MDVQHKTLLVTGAGRDGIGRTHSRCASPAAARSCALLDTNGEDLAEKPAAVP